MAVVTFATPKGGAGKSTLSLLLSIELSRRGYDVGFLEVDHAQHIFAYAATAAENGNATGFAYRFDDNPDTLGATIKNMAEHHEVVVIDLPGAGDKRLARTRAIARSHLVLVPLNCGGWDANMATRSVGEVLVEEEHLERKIPHALVLNRGAPRVVGVSHTERLVAGELKEAGLPVMKARVSQRDCFVSFALAGTTLEALMEAAEQGKRKSIENGIAEISAFADEVVSMLQAEAAE